MGGVGAESEVRLIRAWVANLEHYTEMILRKAYILADDWKIESPELVRQLMPE